MAGLSSDRGPPRRSRRRFLCYAFILLAISISALTGCSSAAAVPRQRSVVHHHHHHHHQHGQQQQQHRTRCPWPLITDGAVQEGPDVAGTRAYLAPVVFEGKARSKSDGPVYRVTFDVVTVYKGQVGTGTQVRLEFMAGNGTSVVMPATTSTVVQRRTTKNNHHHNHNHHNPSNKECLVSADIRTGRRYMVFAAHWGPNNLTAVSSPLIHTKKSLKEVRSTLCPRCARSPVAFGLEEALTVKKQGRLILRCRTRGNPVPAVSWYKDGKLLPEHGKRVRIKTKRRRSTLRIRCVKEEDAGLYECRPTNVIGPGSASRSRVSVIKGASATSSSATTTTTLMESSSSKMLGSSTRPSNGSSSSSSLWPLIALPCPIDSFCLNGGICKYYEAVGELVCQCAEGYKGQRCENKDIYNLSTDTFGSHPDSDDVRALYMGK